MFPYPSTTNNRTLAAEFFKAEYINALIDSLLKKILGKDNNLLSFPEKEGCNIFNRKYRGVTDIPIDKILGSLGRNYDFDRQFRPLKNHLIDRWINVFTTLESENWLAIRVHKIGDIFYVEDGHHRTSVARSRGMAFISAEVWEYASNPSQYNPLNQICSPMCQSVEMCPV